MKYWINVVSRDHVMRGVEGGFTQANHGKPHMLKKLEKSDWIVFYSPKTAFEGGDPLQAFTAVGQVKDSELYQVEMSPGFVPWRRNVEFVKCTDAPIKPLIEKLTFITDPKHWGYMFRFGVFEINIQDFELIKESMSA
jgi:predicted RNA-binding protein